MTEHLSSTSNDGYNGYDSNPQVKSTTYPLFIEINSSNTRKNTDVSSNTTNNTTVTIKCDSMELVAELIQDMCKYLNLTELSSEVDFPREFELFEEVWL